MTSHMMLRKILATLAFTALLLPQVVFAQQTTLLPGGEVSEDFCRSAFIESGEAGEQEVLNKIDNPYYFKNEANAEARKALLSCAIKFGKIHLWMLPYFITGIVNFLIYISGTIAVLFVLLGGFWYMTGGLTDDKEKGKKTITYALMGLVITLLAWIIVNIIMVQVTG